MLLFMDGQAHYDTARIGMKYSTVNADEVTWSVVPEGRFGNAIKRVTTSNSAEAGYLEVAPLTTRLGPWAPTTGGVCGFAIRVDDLTRIGDPVGVYQPHGLFSVMEGSEFHLSVWLNATGTFTLRGNATSTNDLLLAQSIEGLTSGTWMFVEFKWLIDASVGTFAIRVNGVPVLTYAGATREQDLFFDSLGIWNAVRLLATRAGSSASALTIHLCDLYLADLNAALPADVSDFLGDGIVETIRPNAVGAASGWTPNTGANWDATNDSPAPDDDATYVTATAVDTTDLYHFEDLAPGTEVKGAHVCILARKETEGASSIAPIVRQGGLNYVGPTQGVANVVYDRYVTQAWDLNPATLAKFTAGEVNAGQFGVVKVT